MCKYVAVRWFRESGRGKSDNLSTNKFLVQSATSFAIRIFGIASTFAVTIILARWLGAADFGIYNLTFTVVTLFGVLIKWGLPTLVLKKISASWPEKMIVVSSYYYSSLAWIFSWGVIVSLVILALKSYTTPYIPFPEKFFEVIAQMIPLLITTSLLMLSVEAIKGIKKPLLATFLQVILVPFLILGGIIINISLYGQLTITQVVLIVNIANFLSMCISIAYFHRNVSLRQSAKILPLLLPIMRLAHEGWPLFLISSSSLVMIWTDMLMLGFFASPSEIGIYTGSAKLVSILTIVLISYNTVVSPYFGRLYLGGKLRELETFVQRTTLLLVVVCSILGSLLYVHKDFLLSIMGDEFVSGSTVVNVLLIGQYFNVAAGAVGFLLIMTEHERTVQKIWMTLAFINIPLNYVFIHLWGYAGVAGATSICLIIGNTLAIIAIRKNLGFWIWGFSSVKGE